MSSVASMTTRIRRFLSGAVLFSASTCLAQIVTDGTVGPRATLSGPDMTIGAELGATKGANLFHSFQTFDIPTAHTATFTGPEQIQNVISRVTGGKASRLDGTLRSRVGQADVFLVNPSGVVMGPNAQVDVPAAFHVSTADEVRFSDGSRYSATDPAASSLTVAAPESFGFLSPQPASLIIEGSRLELKPGKTATLTAGDVAITGSAGRQASLRAPGGEIRIEAVGNQGGQVPVTKASVRPGSGKLTVKQARIETSGEGGGAISARAGEATLSNATLVADNPGHLDAAGGIDLMVSNALKLSASRIQSNVFGSGASGGVRLRATDLDIQQAGAPSLTGVFSEVEPGATGASGGVDVALDGWLRIQGAAGIVGSTYGGGAAGAVRVNANALSINGEGVIVPYRGSDYLAGIVSSANPGSSGDAGSVVISVQKDLAILNSGAISSATFGSGRSGTVAVRADNLRMDGLLTWITSANYANSTSTAGSVTVEIANLAQLNAGAKIGSDTYTIGHAGQVWIQAGSLELENESVISSTTYSAGDAGQVTLDVTDLTRLTKGARIGSDTFSMGDAGTVMIATGDLQMDNAGSDGFTRITSRAIAGSSGNAGSLRVSVANRAELIDQAQISTDTFGSGHAGQVQVRADTLLMLDGSQVSSDTYDSGHAGQVEVQAGFLELLRGAFISSSAFYTSAGDAGTVAVTAGDLNIDGAGSNVVTGIMSFTGSTGDAGNVTVDVAGLLQLLSGARINSGTAAGGAAGNIAVTAGELRMNGLGSDFLTEIISGTYPGSSGRAGQVRVKVAGLLELSGGARINSQAYASGDAGEVSVEVAGLLALTNGGQIDSSTYASGNAGAVRVRADQLRIDGTGSRYFTGITSGTYPESTGNADQVMVEVAGLLELLDGGQIDSSTSATGHAGSVTVKAGQLRLDGGGESPWRTAITTQTYPNSAGNAGNVTVEATGLLEILRGATIDSFTLSAGDAGTVDVTADELRIDGAGSDLFTGITSQANSEETGQVGDVSIRARTLSLVNRGQISIGAYQTLPEDRLTEDSRHAILINATNLYLNGGIINAQSTGNVPASSIEIHAGDLLLEDGSRITTEAQAADAGPIAITGGRLWLTDSLITTSANGTTGDGGNITLTPEYLILDGGFIQANTAAQGARGGSIRINTRALIASQGLIEIGGATRQDFVTGSGPNIIQAAAPGGEQGTINVTAPDLDLTASLIPLATPFDNPDDLFTDLCRAVSGERTSALIERGSGGLPLVLGAPGIVSFSGVRLDQILGRSFP